MQNSHKLTFPAAALLLLVLAGVPLRAQRRTVTLDEAVTLSLETEQATVIHADSVLNAIESRRFRIQNLPKLSFSGTLPNLVNSIQPITMTDGSEQFVQRSFMSTSASLSLSQNIPFTGGTLSLSGGLSRLDNFIPERRTSFSTSIFSVSYSQSLSTFNAYRWDKRIQKARESAYATDLRRKREGIKGDAVSLFFDLLSAQKQAELTEGMLAKAESAVRRSERLRTHNKTYETTLTDARIDLARLKASTAPLQLERARRRFTAALGLAGSMTPEASFDIEGFCAWYPGYDIDEIVGRALQYGLQQERDLSALDEDKQIARQKAAGLPTLSISAGAGMNASGNELTTLLDLPSRSTSAMVSLSFPIINWGANRLTLRELRQKKAAAEAEHALRLREYESQCRYELQYLGVMMENIRLDGETLRMLTDKLNRLTDRAEFGKADLLDINETRNQILQTEARRIERIKEVYGIIYKYRKAALFDILMNRPIAAE